jgi:FkbM family methyltransferase
LERIYGKGLTAFVRPETSDPFVFQEVTSNTYRKLNIHVSDIVLDIGMNIGIFSCLAIQRGAKRVIGFEAEPKNYEIALENIRLNGCTSRCNPINLAVVGNKDTQRDFFINVKKNKGAHSLVEKRGRDVIKVNCIDINDILEKYKPTVMKMDIEGGEYELIKSIKSFRGIREFIFEFHHAHLNDIKTHEKHFELIEIMERHYEIVEARRETKKAWVTLIYCRNPK